MDNSHMNFRADKHVILKIAKDYEICDALNGEVDPRYSGRYWVIAHDPQVGQVNFYLVRDKVEGEREHIRADESFRALSALILEGGAGQTVSQAALEKKGIRLDTMIHLEDLDLVERHDEGWERTELKWSVAE